jgi:hypothetical protein
MKEKLSEIGLETGILYIASSIIIDILSNYNLNTLGIIQFSLQGRLCTIRNFYAQTPRTIYHNCFQLGYTTQLCKNEPRYRVYTKDHHVDTYTCTVFGC